MIASPRVHVAWGHWAHPPVDVLLLGATDLRYRLATARAARLEWVSRKVRQRIYRPNPAEIAARLLAVSELEPLRRSVWA